MENMQRLQDVVCVSCKKSRKFCKSLKCFACNAPLKWICQCGVYRCMGMLYKHSCVKDARRKELRKKFKEDQKVKRAFVLAEIKKLESESTTVKTDKMRIENISNH